MNFHTYARADEYNAAWASIVPRMLAIRSRLESKLQELQRYNNILVADRQAAENIIRQGFLQLEFEDAKRGSYREVSVEAFNSPISGVSVDEQGGYATLPVEKSERIALGSPEIVWSQSSTDSIPGNWGEAQQVTKNANLKDTAVVVYGNDKLDALVDGSASTHFEFERCLVDSQQSMVTYDIKNGNVSGETRKHVLDIIDPDKWEISIPEAGIRLPVAAIKDGSRGSKLNPPIRLKIRIPVADQNLAASQLVVTPYLPSNQLGKAPYKLREVVGIGATGKVLLQKVFTMDRPRSLRLPDVPLTSIELTFVQDRSYAARIAHHYYEEELVHKQKGRTFFFFSTDKYDRYEWRRVSDETQPLGVVESRKGSWLQNVGVSLGDAAAGVGGLLAGIPGISTVGTMVTAAGQGFAKFWGTVFGSTKKWTERQAVRDGWDIFTGERYAIGISEVALSQVDYAQTATAVLGPFIFKQDAKFISIHATYQIPDEYPVGDWIKFEYSVDQLNWTPIKLDDVGSFTGKQAWVRVSMSRPSDVVHSSPLLHEVRVYVS